MKKLLIVGLVAWIATSCTKIRIDPDCYPKNNIEHVADNWKGRISYDSDLEAWFVNYFVVGSIDSFYSGIACNLPSDFKEENLQVIFSGNFKDDKDKIQPLTSIGGQEFYFLELTNIEKDE